MWDSVETQQALANIDACLQRNGNFDDVLDDYAQIYAVNVHSNKKWSWKKNVPDGLNVKNYHQREIKARAVELGLVPDVEVKKQPGMRYGIADFRSAGLVYRTVQLPPRRCGDGAMPVSSSGWMRRLVDTSRGLPGTTRKFPV